MQSWPTRSYVSTQFPPLQLHLDTFRTVLDNIPMLPEKKPSRQISITPAILMPLVESKAKLQNSSEFPRM
jgi:hypothetical protein